MEKEMIKLSVIITSYNTAEYKKYYDVSGLHGNNSMSNALTVQFY